MQALGDTDQNGPTATSTRTVVITALPPSDATRRREEVSGSGRCLRTTRDGTQTSKLPYSAIPVYRCLASLCHLKR
jgi:hypothetical protein